MFQIDSENQTQILDYTGTDSRKFMSGVFGWMFFGLALTGIISYAFASIEGLRDLLLSPEGRPSILFMVAAFAPIGFILLMRFRLEKLSPVALLALFIGFASVMGVSMSSIFLTYSSAVIGKTFAVTSLTFGAMALLGYTTKTDLTKFGSILYMALIGLLIAMLVNYFLESSMMEYIISIIGVLIFTGLTAYDTQKLKMMSLQLEEGSAAYQKGIIMGATSLYLDFVNLFLFLLRLFGGRD